MVPFPPEVPSGFPFPAALLCVLAGPVLGWNTIVGLSRMTVRPELILTLELDLDTAFVPSEVEDGVAIGITDAVEAEMPDGPRGPEAGGTTIEAVPALSCEKV